MSAGSFLPTVTGGGYGACMARFRAAASAGVAETGQSRLSEGRMLSGAVRAVGPWGQQDRATAGRSAPVIVRLPGARMTVTRAASKADGPLLRRPPARGPKRSRAASVGLGPQSGRPSTAARLSWQSSMDQATVCDGGPEPAAAGGDRAALIVLGAAAARGLHGDAGRRGVDGPPGAGLDVENTIELPQEGRLDRDLPQTAHDQLARRHRAGRDRRRAVRPPDLRAAQRDVRATS